GFAAYVEVFERSLLARLVTENQQMHVLSSPPVNELNKRLDQDVHTFPGLHMSGEYDQKATARDSELSVSVAARARSETVGVRAQVDNGSIVARNAATLDRRCAHRLRFEDVVVGTMALQPDLELFQRKLPSGEDRAHRSSLIRNDALDSCLAHWSVGWQCDRSVECEYGPDAVGAYVAFDPAQFHPRSVSDIEADDIVKVLGQRVGSPALEISVGEVDFCVVLHEMLRHLKECSFKWCDRIAGFRSRVQGDQYRE